MAKINVGAATESEMKEKKARVEDALHATRAAVRKASCPAAASPCCGPADGLKPEGLTPRRGGRLQHRRPRLPGADHADRRQRRPGRRRRRRTRCWRTRTATTATTPATDDYGDLVKAGIIDPTKVVRSALQNAASVATLLLTSDALIADMPKEEKKPAGGGGGYDDMY